MARRWWVVAGIAGAILVMAVLLLPEGDDPTPATEPPAAASTLGRPFSTPDYRSDSPALGNFRFDPAPATVVPQLSEAEALAAFAASDFGSTGSAPGATVVARFGLFTGNVPNPPALDGTLTGTHPERAQPAWLIVVDGLTRGRGGGADRDVRAPAVPTPSYAATAVSDDGRGLLTGLFMTTGPAPALTSA